ncbi:hypothetical protein FRB97_003667, partial [Tulasnella sp. 331]
MLSGLTYIATYEGGVWSSGDVRRHAYCRVTEVLDTDAQPRLEGILIAVYGAPFRGNSPFWGRVRAFQGPVIWTPGERIAWNSFDFTGVIHDRYLRNERCLVVQVARTLNSIWFLGIAMESFSKVAFNSLPVGTHIGAHCRFLKAAATGGGARFLIFTADLIRDIAPDSLALPQYPIAARSKPVPVSPEPSSTQCDLQQLASYTFPYVTNLCSTPSAIDLCSDPGDDEPNGSARQPPRQAVLETPIQPNEASARGQNILTTPSSAHASGTLLSSPIHARRKRRLTKSSIGDDLPRKRQQVAAASSSFDTRDIRSSSGRPSANR